MNFGLLRSMAVSAILAATVLGVGAAPVAAHARIYFVFEPLTVGAQCVGGYAAPDEQVSVTWKKHNGNLRASGQVMSSDSGWFQLCTTHGGLAYGDRLKASDGVSTDWLTVPALTVVVDRTADVYHGLAPANSTLELTYEVGILADYEPTTEVTAAPDGTWQYSEDELDILAGFDATLVWTSPGGDSVEVDSIAPEVDVSVGSAQVYVNAPAGAPVSVELRDGTTNALLATGQPINDYTYEFMNNGHAVDVAAGERVVDTALWPDINWIVPVITATANVETDKVHGQCGDGSNMYGLINVEIHRTGQTRGSAWLDTDSSGSFHVSFRGHPDLGFDPANIKHGDRVSVGCILATGDWVTGWFRVP